MLDESLYPKIAARLPEKVRDGLVRSLTAEVDRWGHRYFNAAHDAIGATTPDGWDRWVIYRDDTHLIRGGDIVAGGFVSSLGVALAKVIRNARGDDL